jgi:high-affinity K+ transport system ATPase subunit B
MMMMGNAIGALKARLAIKARLKHDGSLIMAACRDIVPADTRLRDSEEISLDQSALTDESLPVTKRSGRAVFSGSAVRRGKSNCLVVEDASAGMGAARAGSMAALSIGQLDDTDILASAGADVVVESLGEVARSNLANGVLSRWPS